MTERVKKPVICHLIDFASDDPAPFVNWLVCLAQHCSQKLQLETLCVFPDQARERAWLVTLEEEGIHYAFVPQDRKVFGSLKHALRNYEPIIFHSHSELFDMNAVLLKVLMHGDSKVVWDLQAITFVKVQTIGRRFADLFVAGQSAYQDAINRGFPRKKLLLDQKAQCSLDDWADLVAHAYASLFDKKARVAA